MKRDSGEDISRVFNSVDSNSTWIHIRHSHTTEDPRSAYLDTEKDKIKVREQVERKRRQKRWGKDLIKSRERIEKECKVKINKIGEEEEEEEEEEAEEKRTKEEEEVLYEMYSTFSQPAASSR